MDNNHMSVTMSHGQNSCIVLAMLDYTSIVLGDIDIIHRVINISDLNIDPSIKQWLTDRIHMLYYPDLPMDKISGEFTNDYDLNVHNLIDKLHQDEWRSTYTFNLTIDEWIMVYDVIERIARLQMSQLDQLKYITHNMGHIDYDTEQQLIHDIKKVYFPELSSNSYYGVGNPALPQTNAILWDIRDVLRWHCSWMKRPWGGWTVDFDDPIIKWSTLEPLIQVNHEDPNDDIYMDFVKRLRNSIIEVTRNLKGDELHTKVDQLKRLSVMEHESVKKGKPLNDKYFIEVFDKGTIFAEGYRV